jgi:Concanavalin A-like lectin/glucanases superfamily
MLPGITPMLFGGRDTFTKLLLHFDNNYTDSSPTAKGNGTMAGAGFFSNTIFKFGSHSFGNSNNAYVTFPNHADWEFGAGNFTVDWQAYRTAAGAMIARDLPTTYVPFLFGLASGGVEQCYMTSTGSSWDIASARTFGNQISSAWTHYAITRSGSTFRTFQNGTQQDTWTSAAAIIGNSNPLCIGAYANANNFGGYMDELRISKGIARWTANFTPPTAPYV